MFLKIQKPDFKVVKRKYLVQRSLNIIILYNVQSLKMAKIYFILNSILFILFNFISV